MLVGTSGGYTCLTFKLDHLPLEATPGHSPPPLLPILGLSRDRSCPFPTATAEIHRGRRTDSAAPHASNPSENKPVFSHPHPLLLLISPPSFLHQYATLQNQLSQFQHSKPGSTTGHPPHAVSPESSQSSMLI